MASNLLTVKEVAERLGISERQLREMARAGTLPASKHAGRWLIEAASVENVRPLRRLGPKRVRGRLAEGAAVEDFTHRLLGGGRLISPFQRRGAQTAEAEAIEHQLDPSSLADDTARLPAGLKGRARAAQAKALEHLEQRLNKPHPPERSI